MIRRTIAATLVAAALAAGCGSEDEMDGREPVLGNDLPGNVYEIEVNGMPCVVWMDHRGAGQSSYAYSGLDCDWRER